VAAKLATGAEMHAAAREACLLSAIAAEIDRLPTMTARPMRYALVRALEGRYDPAVFTSHMSLGGEWVQAGSPASAVAWAIRAFAAGHDQAAEAAVLVASANGEVPADPTMPPYPRRLSSTL
jgi:hypothetical protein